MEKGPEIPKSTKHKQKPEVYVLRDWKEYLGESFLIMFSVLLALFLTEYITKQHEKSETHELLKNKGWAFDRAPGLIAQYDEVIKMLEKES